MKIQWFGHASFLITSKNIRIITDPFNEKLGYPMFPRPADIVTVSHQHWDHNAKECISGFPAIIEEAGKHQIKDIEIYGINAFHDIHQGQDRGPNIVFKICAEGINIVHLGDLGHVLSLDQAEKVGQTDILLLPVGGKFTVDAEKASEIVNLLRPKIVIPMHYQTPHLSFSLAPLEQFTSRYEHFTKLPCLEIEAKDLRQKESEIIVLDYLLG